MEIKTFNKSTIAAVIGCLLLPSAALAEAPGKPVISWGDYEFALVELDHQQVAYEKLVKSIKDKVEVEVSWDLWSGGAAETARVLVDGLVKWEGAGNSKTASFFMSKGGRYEMVVELENSDGKTRSDAKPLMIADTDGSHMEPLHHDWTELHKPYENKTNSIVGTYFVEWGVYGRDYPLDKAPLSNLNRILYGFIPICGGHGLNDSVKEIDGSFEALQNACAGRDDFKVAIHDPWAAVQKSQKGVTSWSDPYKGNYGQMMAAKQANPHLKILPSIGGWTLSDPFFFMHDESKRRVFVESVREFMETWKFFDGVDIDYEFPGGKGANPDLGDPDIDGDTYVVLMKELREMLDELGEKNDRYYELTSAINVGYDKLAVVDYGEASKYLDHIYMMSYDFYGAWDQQNFNHQTGLHSSSVNPGNEYYASKGVDILLAQGVPANKLIIGAAAYGRGWKGIKDISGDNPFTGTASGPIKGTWEDGVLDYRDIANNHGEAQGFKSFYDAQAEAAYRFNSTTGELISYNNERSVKAKARYALEQGLAGIFHWEVDGDNGELTNAMHEGLGHGNNTEDDDQPVNLPPIARAGQDLTVQGPITVRLNGENSTDPEGGELDYSWKQVSGELLNVRGESSDSVTVEVPAVTQDERYVFELTVVDEHGLSDSDTIEIKNSVVKENNPPIIDLPSIFYVSEGQQLNVAVNAKDPDGDLMDYHWSISPELKIIAGEYTKTVTLLAPLVDSDTQYDISVSVSDGEFTVRAESTIQVSDKVVDELPPADTCTDEDSSADNYPAWDASTIYTNELVSHKGLVFKAKWWVKNSEPLVGNEAWELISELELPWSGLVAYSGGDEVNHDGNRWKAKWWTKNNEPGQDSVWVNIGLATCN